MSRQRFALASVLAAAMVLPAVGQTPVAVAKATGKSSPARAADGHPDLQGVWSFALLTPLERPSDLAGKAVLTDEEAKEYARKKIERENKDNRSGGGSA